MTPTETVIIGQNYGGGVEGRRVENVLGIISAFWEGITSFLAYKFDYMLDIISAFWEKKWLLGGKGGVDNVLGVISAI